MHRDKERRLADRGQDLALRLGVLRGLSLLDNGGLLEHLHGEQLAGVGPRTLTGQEDFSISPRAENLEQIKVLHGHVARGLLLDDYGRLTSGVGHSGCR